MVDKKGNGDEPITIKKYANRRLYNKATSAYVTLDHLSQMVKDGVDFVVYDAKTGDDITRSVLTQIIVEEESKGQHLLPTSFLRHLISFYGDSLEGLVPKYLEHSMQSFAHNQTQIRDYMQKTMDGLFPFNLEEMGKQNMNFFENAMKMMAPFQPGGAQSETNNASTAKENAVATAEKGVEQLEDLQSKLNELQSQLAELSSDKNKK